MSKMHVEFDRLYDVRDVVVFEKQNALMVGVVVGYYLDDERVWYNIQLNPNTVLTYNDGGDVPEWDIKMKLDNAEGLKKFIEGGE